MGSSDEPFFLTPATKNSIPGEAYLFGFGKKIALLLSSLHQKKDSFNRIKLVGLSHESKPWGALGR
jgi:hypothetical protein